jgi:hypothetical protein
MCRAKNGELLTNKNQVMAGRKEHFEEHSTEGSESKQPTRPVDLRDDGVDIELTSREEIEGALKYLKNNKAAGSDFIAAELLKNGEPNLMDASHDSAGLDYRDTKNYRGIFLLNLTYKVFAKILYNRLLPHANAAVQH